MCSSLLRLQGWLSVSYGNRSQLYCGVNDGGLGHSLHSQRLKIVLTKNILSLLMLLFLLMLLLLSLQLLLLSLLFLLFDITVANFYDNNACSETDEV